MYLKGKKEGEGFIKERGDEKMEGLGLILGGERRRVFVF